jgi:hypothetical protein
MHVEPALPSPRKIRDTSPPIEMYIGGQIAKFVAVLIAGAAECQTGKLTPVTKDLGSDLMAELIKISDLPGLVSTTSRANLGWKCCASIAQSTC